MRRPLLPRPADRDDAGLTLIELLVAMVIFSVVVVVFMGGVVSMTRSTTRSQEVTDAGDAARKAFQTMDKQIRYASSVNFPGAGTSGAHYVEFVTKAQPSGLAPLCTQWRVTPATGADARLLQTRTWRDAAGSTRTPWRTVATNVRNVLTGPGVTPPFVLRPAGGALAGGGTLTRQTLVVTLDIGRGASSATSPLGADIRTEFVARNSSFLTTISPSNVPNLAGQSVTPVCSTLLERP